MSASELAAAIRNSPIQMIDDLARDVWRCLASGLLVEDEAEALSSLVEARRMQMGPRPRSATIKSPTIKRPWSFFMQKRQPRTPDRARSLERRRRLAASGPMPPRLASQFTTGELATLKIIADDVRKAGRSSRTLGEIAARAGVSVCTARNALRHAARIGLLSIEERRRPRRPNLPNVVRIVSSEWTSWLARGGSRSFNPTGRVFFGVEAGNQDGPIIDQEGRTRRSAEFGYRTAGRRRKAL